jgi:hypothetical protein
VNGCAKEAENGKLFENREALSKVHLADDLGLSGRNRFVFRIEHVINGKSGNR